MENTFTRQAPFLADEAPRAFPWLNVALFCITCVTTTIVGAALMASPANAALALRTVNAPLRKPMSSETSRAGPAGNSNSRASKRRSALPDLSLYDQPLSPSQ